MQKMAEEASGDESRVTTEEFGAWHLYQRELADVMAMDDGSRRGIVIPYAPKLASLVQFPATPEAVRMRPDYRQLLNAIRVHALLHHELRYKDERGRIHANVEHDYRVVHGIMASLFASSGSGVNQTILDAVEAVRTLQTSTKNVTAQLVGDRLNVHKSVALRRLQEAVRLGLVVNLESGSHRPGQYEVSDKAKDIAALPTPEELAD
jgi:hypothetical protein